jgi:hypothetical protein
MPTPIRIATSAISQRLVPLKISMMMSSVAGAPGDLRQAVHHQAQDEHHDDVGDQRHGRRDEYVVQGNAEKGRRVESVQEGGFVHAATLAAKHPASPFAQQVARAFEPRSQIRRPGAGRGPSSRAGDLHHGSWPAPG